MKDNQIFDLYNYNDNIKIGMAYFKYLDKKMYVKSNKAEIIVLK